MKYMIIEIDGKVISPINRHNKPDRYGEPKLFNTKADAERWIARHSYPYMSCRYEITEVKA